MHIITVIPSFYPAVIYGGPIFSSLYTCKSLVEKGHDVKVLTTNANMYSRLDVKTDTWVNVKGVQVRYFNETIVDKLSLPLLWNMWKYIRQADVVHVQAIFNTPVPVALFYAWWFKKPVLLSPRGVMGDWIMNQGNRFKKYWLKFLIGPFLKHIVWHATAEQEKLEIYSHFPDARITVIPNGIELEMFNQDPYLDKEFYLYKYTGKKFSSGCKAVVSIGRLHKKKGFDILIKAFASVADKKEMVLMIAGQDEGEKDALQALIKLLNMEDSVFLIGPVDGQDKIDFLIHADVFALTSHNENFGNVYAEALAAGVPIVASIHTPWKEVETFNCGKWIPLQKEVIANAMLDLLNEDKMQMSYRCREYVKQFSWPEIACKLQTQFSEMI